MIIRLTYDKTTHVMSNISEYKIVSNKSNGVVEYDITIIKDNGDVSCYSDLKNAEIIIL